MWGGGGRERGFAAAGGCRRCECHAASTRSTPPLSRPPAPHPRWGQPLAFSDRACPPLHCSRRSPPRLAPAACAAHPLGPPAAMAASPRAHARLGRPPDAGSGSPAAPQQPPTPQTPLAPPSALAVARQQQPKPAAPGTQEPGSPAARRARSRRLSEDSLSASAWGGGHRRAATCSARPPPSSALCPHQLRHALPARLPARPITRLPIRCGRPPLSQHPLPTHRRPGAAGGVGGRARPAGAVLLRVVRGSGGMQGPRPCRALPAAARHATPTPPALPPPPPPVATAAPARRATSAAV